MTGANGRQARRQRNAVDGVGAMLLLSGLAWLAVHYGVGAGAGRLPHPAEAWLMRLHGLAAFAALLLLGAIAAAHVPAGWRITSEGGWPGRRGSGVVLCTLAGLLVLTGYMLYYFAPEPVRPALGWIHAAAGVGMAVVLGVHRYRRCAGHAWPLRNS